MQINFSLWEVPAACSPLPFRPCKCLSCWCSVLSCSPTACQDAFNAKIFPSSCRKYPCHSCIPNGARQAEPHSHQSSWIRNKRDWGGVEKSSCAESEWISTDSLFCSTCCLSPSYEQITHEVCAGSTRRQWDAVFFLGAGSQKLTSPNSASRQK